MRITANRIVWDAQDFLSGLHPQYTAAVTDLPAAQVLTQLAHSTNMNPYRYLGYASPGFLATDVTNVSVVNTGLISATDGTEGATNYGYIVSGGAKVHRFDIAANSLDSQAGPPAWPHSIVGTAAEEGSDIITYPVNIGGARTNCVFYSWNDNGADLWNVGIYNLSAATFDDDWMSTVPATPLAAPEISTDDLPHPMIVGDDDTLLIGDGNAVHGLDGATGTNGTFEANRLTLPRGYIIRAFARLPQYLAVFAHYSPSGNAVTPNFVSSGPAKCFVWDYLSLDPTYIYDLNDYVVTAAVETSDGNIGCFTQGMEPIPDGTNRFSKLQLYNGSGFDVVQNFVGNAPGKGGCLVNGGAIYWNSDGVLHSYGSPFPGLPTGLNRVASGSGTTARLLLKQFTSNKMVIASGTTTSGGLQRLVTNQYSATGAFTTSLADPQFPYGQVGKAVGVTVWFAQTATGGRALTLYLQDTINGTTQVIDSLTGVSASNMVAKYQATVSGGELMRFDTLRVIGQWTAGSAATAAPVIRRVEVEYEPINVKRG